MCLDPVSMAVIGIAGGVVQGIGAASQDNTQAQSLNMQADALNSQITAGNDQADYDVGQKTDAVAKAIGGARAGYATNGIASSAGSALSDITSSAESGALDVAAIRWNAKVNTDNLTYQQKVLRTNANAYSQAAPLAFLAPVLGGVAKFGGSFQ